MYPIQLHITNLNHQIKTEIIIHFILNCHPLPSTSLPIVSFSIIYFVRVERNIVPLSWLYLEFSQRQQMGPLVYPLYLACQLWTIANRVPMYRYIGTNTKYGTNTQEKKLSRLSTSGSYIINKVLEKSANTIRKPLCMTFSQQFCRHARGKLEGWLYLPRICTVWIMLGDKAGPSLMQLFINMECIAGVSLTSTDSLLWKAESHLDTDKTGCSISSAYPQMIQFCNFCFQRLAGAVWISIVWIPLPSQISAKA